MEPAVHLRGAVSLIGRFPALAGVDLEVAPAEVVLLQGPNGAGKTTILRCCAGLMAVTSGEARVLGVDLVRDRRSVRRRGGLLGPASGPYEKLTAGDHGRLLAPPPGAGQAHAAAAMARPRPAGPARGAGTRRRRPPRGRARAGPAAGGTSPSAGCRPASGGGRPSR